MKSLVPGANMGENTIKNKQKLNNRKSGILKNIFRKNSIL